MPNAYAFEKIFFWTQGRSIWEKHADDQIFLIDFLTLVFFSIDIWLNEAKSNALRKLHSVGPQLL